MHVGGQQKLVALDGSVGEWATLLQWAVALCKRVAGWTVHSGWETGAQACKEQCTWSV